MIVKGAFVQYFRSYLFLLITRTYWELDPETFPESEAMKLGYYGA